MFEKKIITKSPISINNGCRERKRQQKCSLIELCSDEQIKVKKNLVKFGTRYIRFMLRALQPLKLLSDACIELPSVACVFYSCEK